MAHIRLKSVRIEFPVFNDLDLSLRRKVLGLVASSVRSGDQSVFTALKDVSIDIGEGDRVALVGHNGAGKSTLLRVMANIYQPVSGVVDIAGEVVPLFDVGYGINPDSTGYENIMLRGLLLGMTIAEIREKTPQIEEFCELGDQLHRPVRTYSTGMMTRLAFAISTCPEPEILLMDEAIGAGDASFINRANARLAEFVDDASIVVVASHSEPLLERLCTKAILIDHGRVQFSGPVGEVLSDYRRLVRRGAQTLSVADAPTPRPATEEHGQEPRETRGDDLLRKVFHALDAGDEQAAFDLFRESMAFDLHLSRLEQVYAALIHCLQERGEVLTIVPILDKFIGDNPGSPYRLMDSEFDRAQELARERELPSLLMFAMPTIDWVDSSHVISECLRAPRVDIGTRSQPEDYAIPALLDLVDKGGTIGAGMCTANDHNLALIESSNIRRLVVQVWDPRAAAVSAVDHAEEAVANGHTLKELHLPEAWRVWSIENKVDWLLDLHFDSYVKFSRGWLRVRDDEPFGLRTCVVNAQRLMRGDPAFADVMKFLDLYTAGDEEDRTKPSDSDTAPIARRWQNVLTPSQRQSAADRMGEDLLDYFDNGGERV